MSRSARFRLWFATLVLRKRYNVSVLFDAARICKGKKITYKFYLMPTSSKKVSGGQSESEIQIQIVELLKRVLKGDVLWTFFPAGEAGGGRGGKVRGARLKRMGLQPGWPDLQFLHKGRYFGMEVKTKTGRLSTAQRRMHSLMEDQGISVAVVRSINDVLERCNEWKLLARTAAIPSRNPPSSHRRGRIGQARRVKAKTGTSTRNRKRVG